MASAVTRDQTGESTSLARARIAMTQPGCLNGNYLFELIDVNGPQRGRCLAEVEVQGRKTSETVWSPFGANRRAATAARAQLHAVGRQRGYVVTDS